MEITTTNLLCVVSPMMSVIELNKSKTLDHIGRLYSLEMCPMTRNEEKKPLNLLFHINFKTRSIPTKYYARVIDCSQQYKMAKKKLVLIVY